MTGVTLPSPGPGLGTITTTSSNFVNDIATKTTDGMGNSTTYSYDDFGRLTDTMNANGEVTRYEYDAAGYFAKIKDLK